MSQASIEAGVLSEQFVQGGAFTPITNAFFFLYLAGGSTTVNGHTIVFGNSPEFDVFERSFYIVSTLDVGAEVELFTRLDPSLNYIPILDFTIPAGNVHAVRVMITGVGVAAFQDMLQFSPVTLITGDPGYIDLLNQAFAVGFTPLSAPTTGTVSYQYGTRG